MYAIAKVNINARQSDMCAISKVDIVTEIVRPTSSMHTSIRHITHYHGVINFMLITFGFF